MTWQLTEIDGGTQVEITAYNVPDGVSEENHAAGLIVRPKEEPPALEKE